MLPNPDGSPPHQNAFAYQHQPLDKMVFSANNENTECVISAQMIIKELRDIIERVRGLPVALNDDPFVVIELMASSMARNLLANIHEDLTAHVKTLITRELIFQPYAHLTLHLEDDNDED